MFWTIIVILALTPILTLFGPWTYHTFVCKQQDLERKYNAKWALVTGGSSGIGRAITEKLASQGINVVLVALEDQLLIDFHASIKQQYPNLQFRAIGADFGKEGYLDIIVSGTQDIDISLLFNNAGYVAIGLFADVAIEKQMSHIECNALSSVKITHHFLNKMISKKLKGAIVFTSSPAGQMPCPFSTMYGATKAFLTEFGASIAGEVYADGIDVQVLHPSPVDTNFYKVDSASKSGTLNLFSKTATSPKAIANTIFATLGRGVVCNQGYFVMLRYLLLILDFGVFTWLTAITAKYTGEYKNLKKKD